MPLYEFFCTTCGSSTERSFSIADCPGRTPCDNCGEYAGKTISFRGGLQTDHPAWLNDHVREVLQKDGEKPIETRKEHDDYLKANGYIQR